VSPHFNGIFFTQTSNRFFGKEPKPILSIGAWFGTNLVMQAHIKFKDPKYFSQALPLV